MTRTRATRTRRRSSRSTRAERGRELSLRWATEQASRSRRQSAPGRRRGSRGRQPRRRRRARARGRLRPGDGRQDGPALPATSRGPGGNAWRRAAREAAAGPARRRHLLPHERLEPVHFVGRERLERVEHPLVVLCSTTHMVHHTHAQARSGPAQRYPTHDLCIAEQALPEPHSPWACWQSPAGARRRRCGAAALARPWLRASRRRACPAGRRAAWRGAGEGPARAPAWWTGRRATPGLRARHDRHAPLDSIGGVLSAVPAAPCLLSLTCRDGLRKGGRGGHAGDGLHVELPVGEHRHVIHRELVDLVQRLRALGRGLRADACAHAAKAAPGRGGSASAVLAQAAAGRGGSTRVDSRYTHLPR